jgi:hypothetical protein
VRDQIAMKAAIYRTLLRRSTIPRQRPDLDTAKLPMLPNLT